jgi:hypothetical protein
MVAFFNPLISFLSIYTYCTSEMLPPNNALNLSTNYPNLRRNKPINLIKIIGLVIDEKFSLLLGFF